MYELALTDSQEAFRSLYMAYYTRLLRFVNLYIDVIPESEEVVSDTFLAVWENRHSLTMIDNFTSYIYSIARYKAISRYRTQHMDKVEIDAPFLDLFFHTTTTPEEDLISKETTLRLNAAINMLPPKCRMAFKLVREDRMKYKDAASVLEISVKTLEAHLSTAIKKLRSILQEKK